MRVKKQNSMEKKKFDLEIACLKEDMENKKIAQKLAAIQKEQDRPMLELLRYGVRQLGIREYAYYGYSTVKCLDKFKAYQFNGANYHKAIDYTMWWIAKENDIFDEAKIVRAIKKTKAHDTSRMLKLFWFIKCNPFESIMSLIGIVFFITAVSLLSSFELRHDYPLVSILTFVSMYIVDYWIVFKFVQIWKER